jgi:ribosomal protein S18 acetylase RimI-like enzyme
MDFKIRAATVADLPDIATVHRAAFPATFSTALGSKFVQKMLDWYLAYPNTFLLCAENEEGKIVSYITGMIYDGSMKTGSSSGMAQHAFNQGVISFLCRPWLVFHPETRKKFKFIWRNIKNRVKHGNSKKGAAIPKATIPLAERRVGLITMGTLPNLKRNGIGAALLTECEHVAVAHGIYSIYATVNINNVAIRKCLEKLRWTPFNADGESLHLSKTACS